MATLDTLFDGFTDVTLYHYTGIGGLIGIVDSNRLWASSIFHLNDAAEIAFARDQMRIIASRARDTAKDDLMELLSQLYNWVVSSKISISYLSFL